MNSMDLDRISLDAYNKFQALNPTLLKDDPNKYWREAREFKELYRRDLEYKVREVNEK